MLIPALEIRGTTILDGMKIYTVSSLVSALEHWVGRDSGGDGGK